MLVLICGDTGTAKSGFEMRWRKLEQDCRDADEWVMWVVEDALQVRRGNCEGERGGTEEEDGGKRRKVLCIVVTDSKQAIFHGHVCPFLIRRTLGRDSVNLGRF